MNHELWEKHQYHLAALPTPQRQQAQSAYCDAWKSVKDNQVTEASALRFLTKQIDRLEREGKKK